MCYRTFGQMDNLPGFEAAYYWQRSPSHLRRFQSNEAIVAKLFAKHIKLNEAIGLVKKKRYDIFWDLKYSLVIDD